MDKSINQTAFRLLLVLAWLNEAPHSLAELNARLKAEPLVGKHVSQDTMWFYLNTLKALGCDIQRPSPKTDFRFILKNHPFRHFILPEESEFLKSMMGHVGNQLDYQDMFGLTQWVYAVFLNAANPNREELLERFFAETRIPLESNLEEKLLALETYCQKQQMIQLDYLAAHHQPKPMVFLPHRIFHESGIFYSEGFRANKTEATMLRVDKILRMVPTYHPKLEQRLRKKATEAPEYWIRLLDCQTTQVEPLGLETEILHPDPDNAAHLLLQVRTHNQFLLTQKLFQLPVYFQILSPLAYAQSVIQQLTEIEDRHTHVHAPTL